MNIENDFVAMVERLPAAIELLSVIDKYIDMIGKCPNSVIGLCPPDESGKPIRLPGSIERDCADAVITAINRVNFTGYYITCTALPEIGPADETDNYNTIVQATMQVN